MSGSWVSPETSLIRWAPAASAAFAVEGGAGGRVEQGFPMLATPAKLPAFAALIADGETEGAPIDVADGYVHFSTAAQLPGTLGKHFSGEAGLWVLDIDEARLGEALRWEPARGGDLFPHLYRRLRVADIVAARPL